MTARHSQSQFALHFFLLSVALLSLAGGVAQLLVHWGTPRPAGDALSFPKAFWLTTVFLLAGSAALQRALTMVRLERQRQFRQSLVLGLVAGTAFVGVQTYGLWCLLQRQTAEQVAVGASAFVFVFATLHALHFTVALMFLAFVTLKAFADRYDHEYYWGVTVCTYFWHALAAIWLCIVAVFVLA